MKRHTFQTKINRRIHHKIWIVCDLHFVFADLEILSTLFNNVSELFEFLCRFTIHGESVVVDTLH
jgi:hypothetical protein